VAPSDPAAGAAAASAAEPGGTIPPGRSIAEGGGGPLQYTFREEWRKALVQAQAWRTGAYLISAAGDMVNDDGVPSHWALVFIDRVDADAVLLLEVDPWGAITSTREVTGDGVRSFVDAAAKPIPYAVVDSDTAVGAGKAALAARVDLANTRDPRIGLSFAATDGSGPYWTYTLFDEATGDYVSARLDALNGTVIPPG